MQKDKVDPHPGDNVNDVTPPESQRPEETRKRLKPRHIISSVFAAGLGVQSSRNRERDFTEGSAGAFIAAGLIFTVLFIGGVFLLVQVVLKSAG